MRILTLSTYPISTPRHGGQQRLHHIVNAYRGAGHTVQAAGVLGSPAFAPEDGFLPTPPISAMSARLANPFLMEDWAIGQLAATDDEFFKSLCAKIDGVPQVIHVEQPWMFAFARRYAREHPRGQVRVVYGSANVESELKHRIVSGYMDSAGAQERAELVLKVETEAAANADLVVATSTYDAGWLRAHSKTEIVLAPNGVPDRTVSPQGIVSANLITLGAKFVLYCASAHPPNTVGFFDMFSRGIGFLAPDERIVVAGSAGTSIRQDPRFERTPGLASHFIDAGEVSEECLQGLLETCHAIVLPITQGGGTNLKTAEALWAGRWVVATPVAMRGFETFLDARGVEVREEPTEFRNAMRRAMHSAPLRLTAAEKAARRPLLWEHTLRPLVDLVTGLDPEAS